MYNFSLILGLLFAVYVVVLVWIVVKKHQSRNIEMKSSQANDRKSTNDQQEDLIPNITARDAQGRTVITWRNSVKRPFASTKIYLHTSNNPTEATARFELPKSENELERITHSRNGKRYWYWITLVYQNGNESAKQFIDVVPNTDD